MNFPNTWLREEFDENDFSGNGNNVDDTGIDDISFDDSDYSSGSDPEPDDKSGKPAAAFDPQALTRAIVDGLKPSLEQRQQQSAPQLTEEDFRKQTDYFVVTPDMAKTLFGDEDDAVVAKKVALLQAIADGSAKHALKVAGLMTRAQVEDVKRTYEPMLRDREVRAYDQFVGSIAKASPVLSTMKPVIKMAIEQLKSSGYQSTGDPAKDKKAVLQTVVALARQVDPTFSLKQAPNGGGGRAGMPKMGNAVNGAGGSSGSPGTRGQNKPNWAKLYS